MIQELSNSDMKAGIDAVLSARANNVRIDSAIVIALLIASALAYLITL
jgi:hypothetical protein